MIIFMCSYLLPLHGAVSGQQVWRTTRLIQVLNDRQLRETLPSILLQYKSMQSWTHRLGQSVPINLQSWYFTLRVCSFVGICILR